VNKDYHKVVIKILHSNPITSDSNRVIGRLTIHLPLANFLQRIGLCATTTIHIYESWLAVEM